MFLSSTHEDLVPYRDTLTRALRKAGHDVEAMEDFPARDERPLDECLRRLSKCDYYIGVIAWRYGHIPQGDKSIAELEYVHARQLGKKCFVFLLSEDQLDSKIHRQGCTATTGRQAA